MQDIFDTIRNYHMIEAGTSVVAGVSGGADSVCLLYVLYAYRRQVPFALTVVHVEHGLRGDESLADAAFTRDLCEKLGVPCRIVPAEVKQLARTEGLSVEEAGRRERYRILREAMEACGAQRIAVAHNRDDQAETVLWNLARGSGLRGLGGMSPVRGEIIRPLLFTGRERIEQILTEAGLSWRTDRTNLQQEYTRNRIRLSILPQMERELNGRTAEHIAAASCHLRLVQEYLDRVTARTGEKCIFRDRDGVCVDLRLLLQEEVLIQEEVLKQAVAACGGLRDFGNVHMQALLRLCASDCGSRVSLPGRLEAVREDGILRLVQRAAGASAGAPVDTPVDAGEGKEPLMIPVPAAVLQRRSRTGTISVSVQNESGHALQGSTGNCEATRASAKNVSVYGAENGTEDKAENEIEDKTEDGVGDEMRSGSFCACEWRFKYEFLENSPELMCQIIEKKYTKWLSCDTINYHALSFRTRRPGDYLVVNAAGGRKKLKDYLIDCKIPRDQRDRIWLLADGSHVLWVVGYRISEAAKVTEDTGSILKVQAEEKVYEGEDKDFTDGAGGQ